MYCIQYTLLSVEDGDIDKPYYSQAVWYCIISNQTLFGFSSWYNLRHPQKQETMQNQTRSAMSFTPIISVKTNVTVPTTQQQHKNLSQNNNR